jgi:hypothetical protein
VAVVEETVQRAMPALALRGLAVQTRIVTPDLAVDARAALVRVVIEDLLSAIVNDGENIADICVTVSVSGGHPSVDIAVPRQKNPPDDDSLALAKNLLGLQNASFSYIAEHTGQCVFHMEFGVRTEYR